MEAKRGQWFFCENTVAGIQFVFLLHDASYV